MSLALRFRRFAVIASPVAAALLIAAGYFLDPAIDESGRELARVYAANSGREQVSALAFHFAFAFLAIPTVALITSIRERGAGLANVAGLFAFLGLTTLPGFLLTDFYDIAIYGELGGDAWDAVSTSMENMPGATVLFVTGFFGFLLALPLASLAAWRAGRFPLWVPIVVIVGALAAQAVPGGIGLLIWAAALLAFAYALRSLANSDEGPLVTTS
jgi:hypothetical protein